MWSVPLSFNCISRNKKKTVHKTWHIDVEIISNGSSKISFVSLLRKKLFFLFYILFWYRDFLDRWENLCCEKWKMDRIFQIIIHWFEPSRRLLSKFLIEEKPALDFLTTTWNTANVVRAYLQISVLILSGFKQIN